MRKLVAGTAVAVAALAMAAPAGAQGPNGNNGCGELFRNLGAPGFGQAVSEAARQGGFDEEVRFFCRSVPLP